MTASGHEAAAQSEERAGTEHAGKFDPKATDRYTPWRSSENPTQPHRDAAARHRKTAEQHRMASQALREAEQRFCSGIAPDDRDMSPFYHRQDITVVETMKPVDGAYDSVAASSSPNGARVSFRAVPGLTGEWLQRVVDCHLARNAVEGASDTTMSYCPLAVPHVAAKVVSAGNGFSVEITSDNAESVREIVKRAEALKSKG